MGRRQTGPWQLLTCEQAQFGDVKPQAITDEQMLQALAGARSSVRRWESLPVYIEPGEAELMDEWLAGGRGVPPAGRWKVMLQAHHDAGVTFTRIRVQETPPTDYQRWLEHLAVVWAGPAGEHVRVMPRTTARRIAWISPATDWWLVDNHQLIVMRFDAAGCWLANELYTGGLAVTRARAMWNLAVLRSTPVIPKGVLASGDEGPRGSRHDRRLGPGNELQ
jgi:hypothetical protein